MTSDYNKSMSESLDTKIKQKSLVDKSDIILFIGNSHLDIKMKTLVRKAELESEQDKITKLQAFSSSDFCEKVHFEDDGIQFINTY